MNAPVNVDSQALRGAAKAFATNRGIKDSAKLEQEVDEKISALSKGMDLSPAELRHLATIVLKHTERVAHGKHTQAETDEWSRKSIADLKTRHVSMRRVSEIIHSTNAWLKAKYPAIHEVLKRDGNALGSHPFVVRHLTDRYLQHEKESARTASASKWPQKARADQMAATVAPGGLLAGNVPAATVGATALKSLGRRPLGATDAS